MARLISRALQAAARALRALAAVVEQSDALWAILLVTTGAALVAAATVALYAVMGLLWY